VHAIELHEQRVLRRIALGVVHEHDLTARAGVDEVAQHEFSDAA